MANYSFQNGFGQKYQTNYDGRLFTILNLTGNSYEVGYLQGYLMKEELKDFVSTLFKTHLNKFIKNQQILNWFNNLSDKWKDRVTQLGVYIFKLGLDYTYFITKRYTPARFNDEIDGLGDGSGQNVWNFRQLNLITELFKSTCSLMGIWGNATESGKLIELRTLDWFYQAPISKYPLITVYHLTEEGSIPFANIGWPTFVGSLAGYSSYIGVGQAQRDTPDDLTSRYGKPWNYALRDVLQFHKHIDSAVQSLNQTQRTCGNYIGIGSSLNNTYRIIQEAAKFFNVSKDDYVNVDNPNSIHLEGVVYEAFHSAQCFQDILLPYYGNIDVEVIRQLAAADQTGDTMILIMEFVYNHIHLAYPNPITFDKAYNRPMMKIDLNPFLMTPPVQRTDQ